MHWPCYYCNKDYLLLVHIVFTKLHWSESFLECIYYFICVKAIFAMILILLMKYCQEWSMYLVYIYNSFIFNLFLTFSFTFLTFIYVFVKIKLVLQYLCGRIVQEKLPWHPEELNVAKQLVSKIFASWFGAYCIYIGCF